MNTPGKSINAFILSIFAMISSVTVILSFILGPFHPLAWLFIIILIFSPYLFKNIAGKNKIAGDESMRTGIDLIDKDHKTLIVLVNQLQQASESNSDEEKTRKLIEKIIDYTKYHFAREEYLMEINHYPELERYKKQHNTLINRVSQYAHAYRQDKLLIIDNLLMFLRNWLTKHIKQSDQDYLPYIKITSTLADSKAHNI